MQENAEKIDSMRCKRMQNVLIAKDARECGPYWKREMQENGVHKVEDASECKTYWF